VSNDDLLESLEFTARMIQDDVGTGHAKIHPISARWALEGKRSRAEALVRQSLLPDFERHLQDFLVHEKGTVFLRSIIDNLLNLISDETVSFQLESEAVKLPLAELTEKIARFEEEIKGITNDREHNEYLLKGHLNKIVSQMEAAIGIFKKAHLPLLQGDLEKAYLSKVDRGGGHLREELEEFVFDGIQQTFVVWRQELTDKISAKLEEAHLEFATKTNETIERILKLTSDIFELRLKPFTSVEALSKKSDFYFLLKDDPVGLELIQLAVTSALPKFIAKKLILKNMQTAVAELLDRHCGRVRYDLAKRLNKTVRDFQQVLNEKIDLTLEGIRLSFQKALTMHQKSSSDVEENLAGISKRLGAISILREELLAYRAAVEQGLAIGSKSFPKRGNSSMIR